MSKPTVKELDEGLKALIHWERFAVHLPGVEYEDIGVIRKNKRGDVIDQKLDLYETWLKAYPDASWSDVVKALETIDENTIASNLRVKFPESSGSVNSQACIRAQEEVVDKLESLHDEFVLLANEVKDVTERNVEENKTTLGDLVQHVEEQKAFNIQFQKVEATNDFFKVIKPHYNFLDCYLIISLAVLLTGAIATNANEYKEKTKKFMRGTEINNLRGRLQPYFQKFMSNSHTKVLIILENAWGTQSVWLVKQLVKQLFSLQHPDQCQWFHIISGSLTIILSTSGQLVGSLIERSRKKTQFMKLMGITCLKIGDDYDVVLNEQENDDYSFEYSLIQATVENNIEAVEFLLQKIQVDVNVQTNHSIIKKYPEKLYMSESFVATQLSTFHVSFMSLIEDVENELQRTVEHTEVALKAMVKHTTLLPPVRSANDFIQAIKPYYNFLNYHLMSSLVPFLPDKVSQRVKEYSYKVELFFKEANVTYLKNRLELYFNKENSCKMKVTMVLENAWNRCSMWFIEQLLQSIFSPTHLSLFQWFRVNPGSVSIVFLAPKCITSNIIQISAMKIDFMKLVGIISLQIGNVFVLKSEKKSKKEFSFKEAVVQAKTVENNGAVKLLEKVEQESVAIAQMFEVDNNKNYILNIDAGATPLIIACCNDNTQLMKLLLTKGADPNIQTSRKILTALIYTSLIGNSDAFRILLDHGADINSTTVYKETVMHSACIAGNTQIMKIIIRENPDLMNVTTFNGATPLHSSSKHGNVLAVKQLIKAQADPNHQDNDGETPLHRASHSNHPYVVEQLLQALANPNIQNHDGATPLHMASYNGHQQIVELLLQAHAVINICNHDGETPLHGASYSGHVRVVKQLLQAQADPNIRCKNGKSALDIARQRNHLQIVELLTPSN